MVRAASNSDVLSRVRREQRTHGKSSAGSGLRIVLFATGITIAILLFAFGAIGMLLMARSPQEPIASKLDLAPPVAQQTEVPPVIPQAEAQMEPKPEPDSKSVKTFRVIAPPPAAEKNDAVVQQQQVPSPEPETTAAIPNPPVQTQQQPQVPQRVFRQRAPQQQQAVRRQPPNSQSDNPLFQLFGIKQYR